MYKSKITSENAPSCIFIKLDFFYDNFLQNLSKSSLLLLVYKADCSALYTIYIDPKKPQIVLHSKVAESIQIQKWDKSKFYWILILLVSVTSYHIWDVVQIFIFLIHFI